MFCIGRELDSTVIEREADWRRLIAKVRAEFDGPLVYSANFDSWDGIGFWDALDFIGVSAYFPLSDRADPSLGELEAGWDRALGPLEAASKRWGRPVLLTETGFPSIASAARAPWKEEKIEGRRLAAVPLLRGDAAGSRRPPLDRGRLLLALGALLQAGLPRPLPHDPRQARHLHDVPLVLGALASLLRTTIPGATRRWRFRGPLAGTLASGDLCSGDRRAAGSRLGSTTPAPVRPAAPARELGFPGAGTVEAAALGTRRGPQLPIGTREDRRRVADAAAPVRGS